MNKYLKLFLYGVLVWLIPFISSFPFYTKEGVLLIDVFLFKSIMIVIGSISAAFLLVFYFKKIKSHYVREGILAGAIWLGLSLLLDIVILIPMSGMSLIDYLSQIGLRYVVIPVMCILVGFVLANKK